MQFVVNGFGVIFIAGLPLRISLWRFGDCRHILWLCHDYLCWAESWRGTDRAHPSRYACGCPPLPLSHRWLSQAYAAIGKVYSRMVHFRDTAADFTGDGCSLSISFYYECLSAGTLYSTCHPFCNSGNREYTSANAVRHRRICHAHGNGDFLPLAAGDPVFFMRKFLPGQEQMRF